MPGSEGVAVDRWEAAWVRIGGMLVIILTTTVLVATPAEADVQKITSWRNCDNKTSGFKHRAKFAAIPQSYGDGTYYIKSKIIWQAQIGSDRWSEYDNSSVESLHIYIDNPNYVFTLSHGDRTTWANAYGRLWRAKVVVKLMKERTGPDATKLKDERFFMKAVFRETGSYCG